jgi:hypothetical protein
MQMQGQLRNGHSGEGISWTCGRGLLKARAGRWGQPS